jgi:hypothetical protein
MAMSGGDPPLEPTLAARERVLGAGHSDTVATRNSLALADRKAARAQEPAG